MQQATLLTALTHALTVTLVTPVMGPEKRVPRDSIQGAVLSSSGESRESRENPAGDIVARGDRQGKAPCDGTFRN